MTFQTKKIITALTLVSGLIGAGTVSAVEYRFVIPMEFSSSSAPEEPAEAETPQAQSWDDLVAQNPDEITFHEPDWSEVTMSGIALERLAIENYPNNNPLSISMTNTSVSDISSFNAINSVHSLILNNNEIINIDALSNLRNPSEFDPTFIDIDLAYNKIKNLNGIKLLEEVLGSLRLEGNPDLTDLSGLSDSGFGSTPGVRPGAFYAENGIYIDANISERSGFIPMSGLICNVNNSSLFVGGSYATQADVCETVWSM